MLKECNLEGKVAIVTGAGRGIGKGIALALAEAGVNLTITARTEAQLEQTAAEIRKFERDALVVPADVTKSDQVKNVVEQTLSYFGKLDILVNNAGIITLKPIAFIPGMQMEGWQVADSWDSPLSQQEWYQVLNTNLTAAFLFAQAVGPHFLKQKKGKVVIISSNSVGLAPPYFSAYCVSKAGLSMLTRCLATEWAPYNINVNAIGPGSIITELSAPVLKDPERSKFITDRIPMGRVGETREIGLLVVFLASDAANWITGQTFFVDGGQLSRGNGF